MSADFWAGYASGAIGILVGNPLDLIKTRLQAGNLNRRVGTGTVVHVPWTQQFENLTGLARGAAAPIVGYGALNALLFVTYNRSLALLNTGDTQKRPSNPSPLSIWTAGASGGLAIFFVSAPTELVKCRAQVSNPPTSSLEVTRDLWKTAGIRGLYLGGSITSVRDSVGYGFYFWSYNFSKQALTTENESQRQQAMKVLLSGGLAGVVTWASIFPLDVVKTRVQTWNLIPSQQVSLGPSVAQPLLSNQSSNVSKSAVDRPSTYRIAQHAYRTEGISVFFRGLGICSARAFMVNAVQWAIYEWMMNLLVH